MSPGEMIIFSVTAFIVLIMIGFIWVLFKRKRTIAVSISAFLVTGLAAGYFYYPVYKEQTHAKRYSEMVAYLGASYPEEKFSVTPEVYEEGVTVGRFDIAHLDSPEIGITMQVDGEGRISQTGTWTEGVYPEQEELWSEVRFLQGAEYNLNTELPEVSKVDQFIDGELTVFALKIGEAPAIAAFEYNQAGYGLLAFEEGAEGEFVQIELEGQQYIYIDEAFTGNEIDLINGDEPLDVADQKGRLIIQK